jgi:hypothetical protein
MWRNLVVELLEQLKAAHNESFAVSTKNGAVCATYGSMHGVHVVPENGHYVVVAWNHTPPLVAGQFQNPEHAAIAAFAALRVVG